MPQSRLLLPRSVINSLYTPVIAALFILLGLLAIFSLRTSFYDFDLVHYQFPPLLNPHELTVAQQLDQVLASHLTPLSYIRSFDASLVRKSSPLTLSSGHIDQCEVRQGDFYKFTQWQKLEQNANTVRQIAHPLEPSNWTYYSSSYDHSISGRLIAAANGISYYDAYAYCQAAGGRLPFSEEWVAIASGKNQNLYPWGDTFDSKFWPYLDPLLNAAQKCDTSAGLASMGAYVSEWTQNSNDPTAPIVQGGNGYHQPHALYSLNQLHRQKSLSYRSPYLGFRCLYDGEAKPPTRTPWAAQIQTQPIEAGEYETGIPEDARLPSMIVALAGNWSQALIDLVQRRYSQNEAKLQTSRSLSIMRYEVTRAQYRDFLRDPLVWVGLYASVSEPTGHSYQPLDWPNQLQQPELPVSGIDWWSARAFANWANARLPTAEEWLRIASNEGTSIYPWGNHFQISDQRSAAVTRELGLNHPLSGGAKSTDRTSKGIADMGGNLSEWTASLSLEDGGLSAIVKGGNYLLPGVESSQSNFSISVPFGHKARHIGFRLIVDDAL